MVSAYFSRLHVPLSRERLEAYRPAGGDDLELLANYFWNLALSEALYPVLQGVEIALRNCLHAAGTATFHNNDLWFELPTIVPLQSREQEMVTNARANLLRHGKSVTAGRLVAELNFGFWLSLFNRPYKRYPWAPPTLGLLMPTFPPLPRRFRSRHRLYQRLDRIRRLRNRVFHHEPIWNWNLPNLGDQHTEIIETIGWMSPAMQATTRSLDRFPSVYQPGNAVYRRLVLQLIRTLPP